MPENIIPFSLRIFMSHLYTIFYRVSLFSEIKTFDDGTNNINQKSIMYENKNISATSKLIRKIMGRKYHKDEILKLDAKHYTLFPNRTNIIKNTEGIILVHHNGLPDTNNGFKKSIIGHCIY